MKEDVFANLNTRRLPSACALDDVNALQLVKTLSSFCHQCPHQSTPGRKLYFEEIRRYLVQADPFPTHG
jgi:hypothetical protein